MRLSVLIPAHNEEACLGSTVRALYEKLHAENIEHEILVVNDHSTDETQTALRAHQKEIPTLKFVANLRPRGYGRAVQTGLENFTGDVVAVYMADASDAPEDLVSFFQTLQEKNVDCVFGTRFSPGGKTVDYPVPKLILNRLGNAAICLLFNIRYNDVTNAFKMFRRHVIVGLQPLLSQHYNMTVELPLKAIVRGFSYAVVPNAWINRKSGVSKFKIKEMGSRYLFIIIYCFIEKWLGCGDYATTKAPHPRGERG